MKFEATVFDVLEADARSDEDRSARALAAARVRGQKFAKYVAAYGEDGLDLVADEIDQLAEDVTAEYGGDADEVRAAVLAMLKEAMPGEGEDSYQGERVSLPSAGETGLGEASPKIDKSELPESLRQEPIDVGSVRNPAERQSIQHDVADLGDTPGEAIAQATNDATSQRVDADKPMQPEFNSGDATRTWTKAQQEAVTRAASKWSVAE